ncbi:protease Do-like 7 [Gossypium australe]|uniref:Protease Do-like 7 n=1 Tax=Gossypium australe TaxID=47621 RepID=A0A5B6VQE5_9ROSI|nr:protease Do-like 7 [Gossypium australe]
MWSNFFSGSSGTSKLAWLWGSIDKLIRLRKLVLPLVSTYISTSFIYITLVNQIIDIGKWLHVIKQQTFFSLLTVPVGIHKYSSVSEVNILLNWVLIPIYAIEVNINIDRMIPIEEIKLSNI